MSYSIQFEDRKEYLYAYVEGKDSLETSMNYWREIAEKALADGFKKVLIEENLDGQLSDLDLFQLTSQFLDMGYSKLTVGFVDSQENTVDRLRFGELVATNRGIKGKLFEDIAKAEAWLLKQ